MEKKTNQTIISIFSLLLIFSSCVSAQLRTGFYRDSCPNVENIVQTAVRQEFQQTFVTAAATLELFLRDCLVDGCDASIMIASPSERDHPDDMSLAGDGFDTVIKAKQAVDRDPNCRNKVSCADILALATREVVVLTGGPSYPVELGRRDGRLSTQANDLKSVREVVWKLVNLNKIDYNNQDEINKIDFDSLRAGAAALGINTDPITPPTFDNAYFKNLQQGRGSTSDQELLKDQQSRAMVNLFANSEEAFRQAFISAITKLGRVGVKTGNAGEIRRDCSRVN